MAHLTNDFDHFLSDAGWRDELEGEDEWDLEPLQPEPFSQYSLFDDDAIFQSRLPSPNPPSHPPLRDLPAPRNLPHTSFMGTTSSSALRSPPSLPQPLSHSGHVPASITQRPWRTSAASPWRQYDPVHDSSQSFGHSQEPWDRSSQIPSSPLHHSSAGAEDERMASSTHRRGQDVCMSLVDLTTETSLPTETTRHKRKRDEPCTSAERSRTSKRERLDLTSEQDIDEIDLSHDDPPISATEALLQSQQQEAIRSQQYESKDPLRVGKHTCIICMEPYTNLTTTACGHLFCHECLTQALIAGEKTNDNGVGNCPVCRRKLQRNNKRSKMMVPMLFMKKSAFRGR